MATDYFASQERQQAFAADLGRYLPQYGGFCGMGAARGLKLEGDPNVWRVVGSKLYLNVNAAVGRRWAQDIPGNIDMANGNWPKIKDKPPPNEREASKP